MGDDVAVVGFGMTNTKTRDHSDLLQKANLKVKCPQCCLQTIIRDCFRLSTPGCASLHRIGMFWETRSAPREALATLEAVLGTPAQGTVVVRGQLM